MGSTAKNPAEVMAAIRYKNKALENATLVLDNGADSIKIGVVLENAKEKNGGLAESSLTLTVPNYISKSKNGSKIYISNQISKCHFTNELQITRAFEKGIMCAFDIQKTIWDYIFGEEALNVDFTQTDILLTEPILNFTRPREVLSEMLFEDFGFRSACFVTASQLAENYHVENYQASNSNLMEVDQVVTEDGFNLTPTRTTPLCTLAVESGYSFTHIIPFVNGRMVTEAMRRITVGGKVLTNQLKEVISYRQFNVLDETYLINQAKEDLCFVSLDFDADMKMARLKWPENKIYREYVMPDFTTNLKGTLRAEEDFTKRPNADQQILRMNNERFSVPELLFNPSDIGIKQMGIGELIHEVCRRFPDTIQPHLYGNILLIGGNSKLPGYRDRVYNEVRKQAPDAYAVHVTLANEPTQFACHGGNKLAYQGRLEKFMVSRAKWEDEGKIKEIVSLRD